MKEPTLAQRPALEAAAREDRLEVITYLLEQGFVITDTVVKNAIGAQSIAALELFLKHGWDINTRWRHYKMPSIWYTSPTAFSSSEGIQLTTSIRPSPKTIFPW